MSDLWQFVLRHGYWLLFAAVLVEQIGAPVPAVPVLLAMGALAALGHFNFLLSLIVASGAALLADWIWFRLGMMKGDRILGWLCKLSLEPDSCVRQTRFSFERYGPATLLFAKFVPGLSTVAPPLAGSAGVSRARFLLFDGIGSVLWAGAALGAGVFFRREVEGALELLHRFGPHMFGVLVLLLLGYLGFKMWRRNRLLKLYRDIRITPAELRQWMDDGRELTVVDLRPKSVRERVAREIPGSLPMTSDQAEALLRDYSRDHYLVFYCNCPNEASSATLALKLKDLGFTHVYPLEGGFDAWEANGFAVVARPGPPPIQIQKTA